MEVGGIPPRGQKMTLAKEWAKRFASDIAVIVLLLVLCPLFFWPIITPNDLNRASFPKGDFSEHYYAFAFYKASELTAGRLPLWNPYVYGGHPFLADPQSAIFYPPGLLTVLIAGPRGFPLIALEGEAILHFFLASLFTYLFARRILRSRLGSLIAAIVFTYGGYLTAYPSLQLSILEVDIWLPLILLFIDLATDASYGRSKGWARATPCLPICWIVRARCGPSMMAFLPLATSLQHGEWGRWW